MKRANSSRLNEDISATLPLDGMRVLDLTDERGEVGPWILGELGADVIKIEPVGGVRSRGALPLQKTMSQIFEACNFAPTTRINGQS